MKAGKLDANGFRSWGGKARREKEKADDERITLDEFVKEKDVQQHTRETWKWPGSIGSGLAGVGGTKIVTKKSKENKSHLKSYQRFSWKSQRAGGYAAARLGQESL